MTGVKRERTRKWGGPEHAESKKNGCRENERRAGARGVQEVSQVSESEDEEAVVPTCKRMATNGESRVEGDSQADAIVPSVRVYLLQSLRLPPRQSTFARVKIEGSPPTPNPVLLEYNESIERTLGLRINDALIQTSKDGSAQILIANPSGFTQRVEGGVRLGNAVQVTVETPDEVTDYSKAYMVSSDPELPRNCSPVRAQMRKTKLEETLEEPDLADHEKTILFNFLADHHYAFCLEEGERGETDLIEMEIDTGDAHPRKQPLRRMPFSLRKEVARLLHDMQQNGIIEPSKSPWASPVVLVKKRDGNHRFCVDYRGLKAVTTADSFPLPRIDDLLDQLRESEYFSTIDSAAGFWQIRMHPSAKEKTAFVTPQGLYEFRVMPFGLTNAPGVFQRLMQQVIMGLNPTSSPDFVSVYLDDILVFSRSLEDHLNHLRMVITRLVEVGLKLKPTKCHFARRELEHLGHVVTRDGLKTNPRLIEAVSEFPTLRSVQEVRRFLGLSSYYRRFIRNFAKIAAPLHQLTRKETQFWWSTDCASAFNQLKMILTSAPVLVLTKSLSWRLMPPSKD